MKYICQICGYIYDDAKEKIAFADLPDDWKCPLCGAAKSDFKPEEEKEIKESSTAAKPQKTQAQDADLQELSAGQLAALCSNLARSCRKQYMSEESKLFSQLEDYFTEITPQVDDATVENVAELLRDDITNYPSVRATADKSADRGAARVCVWGEKITRMLSSLVERYKSEGEAMLEGKSVWICTVCGFVYVGDAAPKLCPVCKVPTWKLEKIEGRA